MVRVLITVMLVVSTVGAAEEERSAVTLATVVDPGPNTPDEVYADAYSLASATHFLDSAALQWQKQRKCFTCHTNFAYLYARPYIDADAESHRQVRAFAEELVTHRWVEKGPRWDAEVVATAAALAFNDARTTGKLAQTTRTALDRMWTLQREDGGWDWLKCQWPPMESDDHYGATIAAIACGIAPDDYRQSENARNGMRSLRTYFASHVPETLHQRAMLMWASRYHEGLISAEQRQACQDEIWTLQKPDGGWALATLGNWQRQDDGPQDLKSSDGYATGFAVFVLRQSGVPADDARLQRGVDWLKTHQRRSGRWFTRSLFNDNKHFISHAGTAFAVMALAECGQLHTPPPASKTE